MNSPSVYGILTGKKVLIVHIVSFGLLFSPVSVSSNSRPTY